MAHRRTLPAHAHIPASSNVASAIGLLDGTSDADAAISPPGILEHHDLELLAANIGDNPNAVTRFVLVSRTVAPPAPTGADKTSLIAELPDDHPGALLEMLEQFATRGINLSLLASRPIGDALGRYRFVIDADGHIEDERMADALLGLRRFSPKVVFLGSYPRADRAIVHYPERYSDDVFVEARDWLRGLLSGEPEEHDDRPVPFAFDPADERARARARAPRRREQIAWFGTIGRDGYPHAVPIWFLWHDGRALIISEPHTAKVRNLRAERPRACCHLEAGEDGEQLTVLRGTAAISPQPTAEWLDRVGDEYARSTAMGSSA